MKKWKCVWKKLKWKRERVEEEEKMGKSGR